MKKFLMLIILLLLIGANSVQAQYPIPSFNILVNDSATFRERIACETQNQQSRGKRRMIVKIICAKAVLYTCSATVWVYSLDGLDVLGPYLVTDETTLGVDIDDRAWGTRVVTEDAVLVDVWINEE